MPRQFQKHFTLAEAQQLIPTLRLIFRDAHHRRQRAQKTEAQLSGRLVKTGGDVGGPIVVSLLMELVQLNAQLQRIQKLGVQVKDFERGLVDFPHLRNGREVFLCWELDEDEIEFWHDLDTGYAGRERL